MLFKPNFVLTAPDRREIRHFDLPSDIMVPLVGHQPVALKKNALLAPGMLLATHSSPNVGDMHSPVYGALKNVNSNFIEIEPFADRATKSPPPPEPAFFEELDPEPLAKLLKGLGISVRPFRQECETLIINGLNPEPGIFYPDELLRTQLGFLQSGIRMIRRLSPAKRVVLCVAEGTDVHVEGAEVAHIKPVYPNSLAELLVRAVSGQESMAGFTVVRLNILWGLGLVAESGLPLTHAMLTVQGHNFRVPVGTTVGELLEQVDIHPQSGDSVILGSVMRGTALGGLSRGIHKLAGALFCVPKGYSLKFEDNPCIGCGDCVAMCPMRLRPNMLSRYAEFEQYENCLKEGLDVCIECGMCGYVCPACRPMQQYYRTAKSHLNLRVRQAFF